MSTVTGRNATVSVDVGGQEIVFETGKLAPQSMGAVVATCGPLRRQLRWNLGVRGQMTT